MLKNTKTALIFACMGLMLLVSSCVTPRRVNYLQDLSQGSQIQIENKFEAAIAPYDELNIIVTTSSSKKELASPFNLGNSNSSNSFSNNARYLVDVNGDIQMPILGNIHVAGLTRLKLQDTLTTMLQNGGYIDEPFVMVRFNNFKIFYLGGGKGTVLNISNERCTFLEAMAMLGENVNLHTRRDHIAVMREINGRMVVRYLDPRSSDVFNDPFFMLQQNDFIIADTYDNSVVRNEFAYWLGIGSAVISAFSLVVSLLVLRKVN
jgi:polysaccharide export outer membrane protein